jgi:hypothetical protein
MIGTGQILRRIAAVAALLLAMTGLMAVAQPASAQSTAACTEYVQGGCGPGGGNGGDNPNGTGPASAGNTGNSHHGGQLPFTGYPLTPLVLLLLLLLLAGIVVRATVAVRDRLRAHQAHAS